MSELMGIFGGTFSPPHNGHVHAARVFYEQVKPDRFLIIPAAIPPHKVYHAEVRDHDRLEMCRLAFGDLPKVEISDLEIARGGKSYTVETLELLATQERRIAFLCGTDMMLTLDQWYHAQRIFELADLYCVRRENDSAFSEQIEQKNALYKKTFGKTVTILSSQPLEVTSSAIREQLQNSDTSRKSLPLSVASYIEEKGLYR